MKKTFILISLLTLPITVFAQQDSFRVYESGKPVLYQFRVEKRQGLSGPEWAVFDRSQYVLPKFVVRPSITGGYKVSEAGRPVLPIKEVTPWTWNKREK